MVVPHNAWNQEKEKEKGQKMKKVIMRALVNLAMIQAVLLATSANVAFQIPVPGNTGLMVFAVAYIFSALVSLIPSILVSLGFAYAFQGE